MRWTKDEVFIELEYATSVDKNDEVVIVSTNLSWNALPLEFKLQVSKSNIAGCQQLRNLVSTWALKNGFSSA